MPDRRWFRVFLLSVCLLLAGLAIAVSAGCAPPQAAGGTVPVAVTLLPQAEFVRGVGGDRVSVTVMVPPGASPHTYEPEPSQIAALSRAKMYAEVGSGVEFELSWMDKLIAQNRGMLVVDCSRGIDLLPGGEGGRGDPHIWLSPKNAEIMVRNIADGLAQVDPANRAYYEQQRDAYLQKLEALDRDLGKKLSGLTGRTFMVYHPVFGYFARDYDLEMIAIENEGKEPQAADLVRLVQQAKDAGIKVIFAGPQVNTQSAQVIAREIGGRVVLLDPLAEDYLANMRRIGDAIVAAGEETR
ncbi:MAG: zinc ABC transporter substrate-binding protein [Chloroflexota bacterium]